MSAFVHITSALPPGADILVAVTDFRLCDPTRTLLTAEAYPPMEVRVTPAGPLNNM